MLKVRVETFRIPAGEDAKPEHCGSRVVDYNEHDNRVWVSKHLLWAMNNGCGVQIEPVAADTPLEAYDPELDRRKKTVNA